MDQGLVEMEYSTFIYFSRIGVSPSDAVQYHTQGTALVLFYFIGPRSFSLCRGYSRQDLRYVDFM